jgi:hypothetical protein
MISVAKDSMNYIPGNLETDIPDSHVILSSKIDLQERRHLVTLFCCIISFKHNVVKVKQIRDSFILKTLTEPFKRKRAEKRKR